MTPRVAFISASFDMGPLAARLRAMRPQWRILVWPESGWEEAEVAVGWDVPRGIYAQMPRLALVHGIAAGVDNLIGGHDLRHLAVCRVIDAAQTRGMVDYVLWGVLYFQRFFGEVLAQQRRGEWRRPPLRDASGCRVGIMGMGAMGANVALALAARGYRVSGFSRTLRPVEGVETFAGEAQWHAFLAPLDILVCTLPLTPATRNILSRETFDRLPHGAALIHAGRGEQLVAEDLREALKSGRLRGAVVDVFAREPLPPDDPSWRTPGLVVTPHMATLASPETILSQIADNVGRLMRGEVLNHRVDVSAYALD